MKKANPLGLSKPGGRGYLIRNVMFEIMLIWIVIGTLAGFALGRFMSINDEPEDDGMESIKDAFKEEA